MWCCCTHRNDSPLRRTRRNTLPPLFKAQPLPPSVQLITMQALLSSLGGTIGNSEEETDEFRQKTKELIDESVTLKKEFLENTKTLAALKHLLRRMKNNKSDDAQLQALCSELCVFENLQRQFEEKMLRPCECEASLYLECKALEDRWQGDFEDVKHLLQRVQELQADLPSLAELKAPPHSKEKQKQLGILEAAIDVEASVLYIASICQKKFQQLKSISAKLRCSEELKTAAVASIAESEGLRKQVEAMQRQEEVVEEVEEVVQMEEVGEMVVAAEAQLDLEADDPLPVTWIRPPPLSSSPFLEPLDEAQSEVLESTPIARSSVFESTSVLTLPDVFTEPKPPVRSEQRRFTDITQDRSFTRESRKIQALTWKPSEVAEEEGGGSFSPYETFALFDAAVKTAQPGDTPRVCMDRFLQQQYKDHADKTWTDWLASLHSYSLEDLPYAKVILAALQQGDGCFATPAAKSALELIIACNRLAQAVENDSAADSQSYGEVTLSEEFEKTLYNGGLMYWVDCIDLIYSGLTPGVGMLVLQKLKPQHVELSEYVTFQICHKMHVQHLDGIKIFKLLDRNHNGKLDATEFSKGLHELLSLWITEEDITHTFINLYNRWSGLVSKTTFSKQVNFTEYLRKCRGDFAHLAKYTFLTAYLDASQACMREALGLLQSLYEMDEDPREVPGDILEQCFRIATDHTDVSPEVAVWRSLLASHFNSDCASLNCAEATQAFVDCLCK